MQYREKHALHDQWACHAIYHVIVTKRGYRGESFRAHYVMLAHYSDCFLYLSYILYIKKNSLRLGQEDKEVQGKVGVSYSH